MSNNTYFNTRRKTPDRPAAAALLYDPAGDKPPEVLAAGRGVTAREIVELAKANGIALHQDPGLVEALSKLDVGTIIPRELYIVVAEILAYVYSVDAEAAAR